jgi:hypothetical protein
MSKQNNSGGEYLQYYQKDYNHTRIFIIIDP